MELGNIFTMAWGIPLLNVWVYLLPTIWARPELGLKKNSATEKPVMSMLSRNQTPTERPVSDQPWSTFTYPSNDINSPIPALSGPIPDQSPCATIITTDHRAISVSASALPQDVSLQQFVVLTGYVWNQCTLTVRDCSGYMFTTNGPTVPSSYSCHTAKTVCCECNGCYSEIAQLSPSESDVCAFLFENERCSQCQGFRLEVLSGDAVPKMDALVDNKVTSIKVQPGCELIVYTEESFQGTGAIANGFHEMLPSEWNDVISSYTCSCKKTGNETTTALPTTESNTPTNEQTTTTIEPPTTSTTEATTEPTTSTTEAQTEPTTTTTTEAQTEPPTTTTTEARTEPPTTTTTEAPTTSTTRQEPSTESAPTTTEIPPEITTTTELPDNPEY